MWTAFPELSARLGIVDLNSKVRPRKPFSGMRSGLRGEVWSLAHLNITNPCDRYLILFEERNRLDFFF